MRYFVMVLAIGAVAGVALAGMVAAVLWPEPQVVVRQVVEQVEVPATWEDHVKVETPTVDALISDEEWLEIDRQNDCLYDYLQASGVELTLQTVMAAADWTYALGGPCAAIGADDE